MALLQRLSVFVQGPVGQSTLRLEPHALHLIQVLYSRGSFLQVIEMGYIQTDVFFIMKHSWENVWD